MQKMVKLSILKSILDVFMLPLHYFVFDISVTKVQKKMRKNIFIQKNIICMFVVIVNAAQQK